MAARHPERIKTVTAIGNGGIVDDAGAEDFEPEALEERGQTDFIEKVKCLHAQAHRGNWPGVLQAGGEGLASASFADGRRVGAHYHAYVTYCRRKRWLCHKTESGGDPAHCPQAEIMIVEGCGHRPHMPMEKAIEVNNRIFDFLGRAEGRVNSSAVWTVIGRGTAWFYPSSRIGNIIFFASVSPPLIMKSRTNCRMWQ